MGLSRKGWVLMTTVILISLIFAFYFLVYVKGNERKIIENNLRVLAKMKDNITNLLDSEEKIAQNQINEMVISGDLKDTIEGLNKDESSKNNKLETIEEVINKFPGWAVSDSDSNTHFFLRIGILWFGKLTIFLLIKNHMTSFLKII